MPKVSMHKELEMLREEVETLRKIKATHEKEVALQKKREEEAQEQEVVEVQETAEEIITSLQEGKEDVKEGLNELLHIIKHDYENLSPTASIIIFALGTIFGHALAKNKGTL